MRRNCSRRNFSCGIAKFPLTVSPALTVPATTAPKLIRAPSPTLTSDEIVAFGPIQTPSPIRAEPPITAPEAISARDPIDTPCATCVRLSIFVS